MIQKAFNLSDKFCFHQVNEDKIRKEILGLDGTKPTPVGDIFIRYKYIEMVMTGFYKVKN